MKHRQSRWLTGYPSHPPSPQHNLEIQPLVNSPCILSAIDSHMHITRLGKTLYGNSYGETIGELFKYLSGNLAPRVPVNQLGIVAVYCDPDTYPMAPPVHPGVRIGDWGTSPSDSKFCEFCR